MMKAMNKFKKISCMLLLCFLMISGTISSYATGSISVSNCFVNSSTGIATIDGTISGFNAGQRITLRVLNPGKNLSDLGTNSAVIVFNHIEQKDIGTDGYFKFEYKMTGIPDYYKVILSTDNVSTAYTKDMSYVEASQVTLAIVTLNSDQCLTKEGLYNYLSLATTQFVLGMDMLFVNSISSLETVCSLLTAPPRVAYTDDIDFRNKLKKIAIVGAVNEATSSETVQGLIQTYNESLGLNTLNRYAVYISNSAITQAVCVRIVPKAFQRIEELQSFFEESVILSELAQMTGYGEVPEWLKNNNDLIGFSIIKYNLLKDKTFVHKAIVGKIYQKFDELKTAFNNAVDTQYNKENTVVKSSGGGNGSVTSSIIVSKNDTTPVIPQIPTVEKEIYKDIKDVEWAKDSINYLTNSGVLSGDGSGNFYPSRPVKREEFVKMIMTAFNLVDNSKTTNLKDVGSSEWYYKYIASAIEKDIIKGYEDNTFGAGKNITRQDMSVILGRVVAYLGKSLPATREAISFRDSDQIASYALESISSLFKSNIVNGFENGTFSPLDSSTRAQATKMVYELYRILQ